ncbi:MAG TPA: hypothetical protein VFB49_13155 [Patescibacteria group bacterium]|nr:hypothetical protein [Patescibacteria group bacterium]
MRIRVAVGILSCAALLAAAALAPAAAVAAEGKGTLCKMTFSLKGWSAFYKTAKGEGTITCDNGQSMKVKVKATGGGITFGKSEIVDGTGKFTEAKSIDDLLGGWAQSEAHAGAGKSADAQALTKGEISLALTGKGHGVDIGFAFGKFTLEKQ